MQAPLLILVVMRTSVLAVLLLSSGVGTAVAAEPHVHGAAFLDIAVDGGELSLALRGAGQGFVGFEHEPVDAAEQHRITAATERLRNGEALFAFSPAAACTQRSASVGPSSAGAGDEHDHDHAHHHADWSAQWSFHCRTPAALAQLRVNLFDAFPGVTELHVQYVSDTFQTGATLAPDARALGLVPGS